MPNSEVPKGAKFSAQPSSSGRLDRILFLVRLFGAIDYLSTPSDSRLRQRNRVRISKSAAVLVGFYIFHAFPNALLLTRKGREAYSLYGSHHSNSTSTRLIEVFLLGAALTHGVLGTRKALTRWMDPDSPHVHGRTGEMMLTGSVIVWLLLIHLFDFRFQQHSDADLDKQVLDAIDKRRKRVKNTLYWMFIIAVSVHAWRGNTKAWLFRLGFRGATEITNLHRLCQACIVGSFGLYSIPLLMDNPYGQPDR